MMINRYGIILITVSLIGSLPLLASPLTDFKWQKRPLLLFAPDQSNPSLRQTLRLLEEKQCELIDRDMIIGIILQLGKSRLNDQILSSSDAAALHNEYTTSHNQFVVILIGKDGGEKYRNYRVPELSEMFKLIDGMPMRQTEMNNNPVDCQ